MRRASTASYSANLKGNYGMVDSKRNLKSFSDPEADVPRATRSIEQGTTSTYVTGTFAPLLDAAAVEPFFSRTLLFYFISSAPPQSKRRSFFGFTVDLAALALDDEAECTKQDIEAKAMEAPQEIIKAHNQVVHEQKKSAAQHVVNDEETWKKFQEQMRAGKGKTGMALKHNLDGLLHTTAQNMEQQKQPQAPRRNRRSSLTDFASSLIRGNDRPQPAAVAPSSSLEDSASSFATWSGVQKDTPSTRRQRTLSESLTPPQNRKIKAFENSQLQVDRLCL